MSGWINSTPDVKQTKDAEGGFGPCVLCFPHNECPLGLQDKLAELPLAVLLDWYHAQLWVDNPALQRGHVKQQLSLYSHLTG